MTSLNISPEICQRLNDIFFLLTGARNTSARNPLDESATHLLLIQAKHTFLSSFFSSFFPKNCLRKAVQLLDNSGELRTKSRAPLSLLYLNRRCLLFAVKERR